MDIKALIRTIPDFPHKGIMFRDITTLLKDGAGLKATIERFVGRYGKMDIDVVAGIESRGFILGTAIAFALGKGFVPVRKKGKLPGRTICQDYQLEYGSDTLEIHTDAITSGQRVLLVDDLLATGGTAEGAIKLIETVGGNVVELAVVIDLPELNGRKKLEKLGHKVFHLVDFDGH